MLGLEAMGLFPALAVEGGALLRDEARHERHHHHAAGPAHLLEDVVGHVAGDVGDRAGRGVGEHHRRIAHLDRLPHRVLRDVAEVDQDAEPVHLAHHVLAEVGEASVRMRTRRRIGPGRVVVVGERHVAGAQPGQDAQDRERARDAVAALDADHRRHLARGRDPLDVVGGRAPVRAGPGSDGTGRSAHRSARASASPLRARAGSTARRPTRTAHPSRRRRSAAGRSAGPAWAPGDPARPHRLRGSCARPTTGRCVRRSRERFAAAAGCARSWPHPRRWLGPGGGSAARAERNPPW